MAKKKLVNAQTEQDVNAFIEGIENKVRKKDSQEVLRIMKELTGSEPKIWGKSIVGFGKYSYHRKNGDEFEWFNVGFSPAKAHLSIYLMMDLEQEKETLARLGPHSNGRGCLYIKKLEKVDMAVLKELIQRSDRWNRND